MPNLPPTHGCTVETRDGTRLFYKDWGTGDPVVFLATRAQSSDMWQYQMLRMIQQGLRCIAYDRRGHGRSDQPGSGYDYDTLADDLAALLDKLDLRDVTLVGHSMGGGEIIRYLTRYRLQRVSQAVFLASATPFLQKTPDNPNGFPRDVLDATANAIGIDFPKWVADIQDPYFGPNATQQMKQWSAAMALQTTVLAAVALDRAIANADFREELKAISIPCLVIHGDKDIFTPLDLCGRQTADRISGSHLLIYELSLIHISEPTRP